MTKFKFAAAAAACLSIAAAVVVINNAGADTPPSSLVGITPCRLLDTRAASPVGEHPGAIASAETATLAVVGTHGECTTPAGASAIVANVTILNPTAAGYLVVFPADAPLPLASNLNWVAGQPPTPNQVTVALGETGAAAGAINVFNSGGAGPIDVIIDIVGRYEPGGPAPSAGNWGVLNRNTIGSPVVELRSGPMGASIPPQFEPPPFGSGSLNIAVGSADEKASFGNEVDFFGDLFADLDQVGFHVYNVTENLGTPPSDADMPNIVIEVNPNFAGMPGEIFSSLVYFPPVQIVPGWVGFVDATTEGLWGGTGAGFTGEACDINGARCTWTVLQDTLDDGGDGAAIYSVSITKGRDKAWNGAVDGLQLNDTVYDFEEHGVMAVPAP